MWIIWWIVNVNTSSALNEKGSKLKMCSHSNKLVYSSLWFTFCLQITVNSYNTVSNPSPWLTMLYYTSCYYASSTITLQQATCISLQTTGPWRNFTWFIISKWDITLCHTTVHEYRYATHHKGTLCFIRWPL